MKISAHNALFFYVEVNSLLNINTNRTQTEAFIFLE